MNVAHQLTQNLFYFPSPELTEDLTPETRKLVYGIFKEYEENTTPLTKRRRQENVTSSPPPSLGMTFVFVIRMLKLNKNFMFSSRAAWQ